MRLIFETLEVSPGRDALRPLAALLLLASLLAGCIDNPNTLVPAADTDATVQIPDGQAAIIVGLAVANPQSALIDRPYRTYTGWVGIDSATGLRAGPVEFENNASCEILDCKAAAGEATQYQLYIVPAGSYALAWVSHHLSVFHATRFQQLTVRTEGRAGDVHPILPSPSGRAIATDPSFAVASGEIAYVGDLTFDLGTPDEVRWAYKSDDSAARAFLAATGLADRMVARPMTRLDGQPIEAADGISNHK